jgi:rhamnose utilization protein RhaD (predicted bifunctional aldolase and dehydrogenase)
MAEIRDMKALAWELASLARELGKEERQLAMLGEGYASAGAGDGAFLVKASGKRMGKAMPGDFLLMDSRKVMRIMDAPGLDDLAVMKALREAMVAKAEGRGRGSARPAGDIAGGQPSTESFLHAICLAEAGVNWVGHTHPVAPLMLLCSRLGAKPFMRGLFPDEVVYCGKVPLVMPYTAPGVPFARLLRRRLAEYRKRNGYPPRLIVQLNHGIIALGATADEVVNITMMCDKWARIMVGALSVGGIRHLKDAEASHIDKWPAEHYRRRLLLGKGAGKRL